MYQGFEREDESQILRELQGERLEEYVYSANMGGRQVTQLSITGTREAARRRGNFKILNVKVEETPEEIRALVRVRDLESNADFLGASSARKDQPFCFTLAVNKAERNALNKMLPTKWLAAIVEEFLQRRKPGRPNAQPSSGSETSQPVVMSQTTDPWTPTVPGFRDPMTRPGLRQIPLTEGLRTFGMLNATEGEVSLIPERPIPPAGGAIQSFLLHRVLDAVKAKHSGVDYFVKVDENGLLEGVFIKGTLEESQIKELAGAAKWAFQRTLESETIP